MARWTVFLVDAVGVGGGLRQAPRHPEAADGEHLLQALAIIDRGGQVHVVPMAHDEDTAARWLIASMIEWAGRSHG